MNKCGCRKPMKTKSGDPCALPGVPCGSGAAESASQEEKSEAFKWFGNMIENCYAYACAQHSAGHPIVGIMCE